MATLPIIPDHVAQGLARVLFQDQGDDDVKGMVEATVGPIQDIENAFYQLYTETLENAVGVNLDIYGEIVGQARDPGQSDDDYRLRIKTRIIQNISQGEPESIIKVYQLLVVAGLVQYQDLPPGGVYVASDIEISDQEEANKLFEQVEQVVPAGVRVEFLGDFQPGAAPFAMDGGLPGGGFGDLNDPTQGGQLGRIWVYTKPIFAFGAIDRIGEDETGGGLGTLTDPLAGGVLASL